MLIRVLCANEKRICDLIFSKKNSILLKLFTKKHHNYTYSSMTQNKSLIRLIGAPRARK